MKLEPARLDVLIWALIYGGLICASVGVALEHVGASYGRGVLIASALAIVAGVVLVWVRSRLPEP